MDKFEHHKGLAVPLMLNDIDTDQIMPKQFLKRVERTGFGEFLFHDWRFDGNGMEITEFPLNKPKYKNGSVLVTGNNFGCGSSREHAPWGLSDFGFKVIIAAGFADIFYNNCFKTGLLPIVMPDNHIKILAEKCEKSNDYQLSIDLQSQSISDLFGFSFTFEIEPFRKYCLIEGLDDIGLTERFENNISDYEAVHG